MSFLVTAPATPASEPPIENAAFWPEIDPVEIRDAQRIDNTVTPVRLRYHIVEAIAATNDTLRQYRLDQQALGIASLEEVPAELIDGESVLLYRYRRAVGCLTKAILLERYKDIDITGKAEKRAETLTDPIDDLRRDWHNAIADIVGRPRTVVELI